MKKLFTESFTSNKVRKPTRSLVPQGHLFIRVDGGKMTWESLGTLGFYNVSGTYSAIFTMFQESTWIVKSVGSTRIGFKEAVVWMYVLLFYLSPEICSTSPHTPTPLVRTWFEGIFGFLVSICVYSAHHHVGVLLHMKPLIPALSQFCSFLLIPISLLNKKSELTQLLEWVLHLFPFL